MKIETGFFSAFLIGLILKFIPLQIGNIIVVLSLSLLAAFYMFGAFYLFAWKKRQHQRLGFSIPAGFFLSIPVMGILYKIMYWPGTIILGYGVFFTTIFLILAMIRKNKETTPELKRYYENMVRRCVIIFIFSVILFFTPANTLIHFQYRNDPEMARLLIRARENPHNKEYVLELQNYRMSKKTP